MNITSKIGSNYIYLRNKLVVMVKVKVKVKKMVVVVKVMASEA